MSAAKMVYQALVRSKELTHLLAHGKKSIYHGRSPDAGTYPIIVYSVISDVPVLAVHGVGAARDSAYPYSDEGWEIPRDSSRRAERASAARLCACADAGTDRERYIR